MRPCKGQAQTGQGRIGALFAAMPTACAAQHLSFAKNSRSSSGCAARRVSNSA